MKDGIEGGGRTCSASNGIGSNNGNLHTLEPVRTPNCNSIIIHNHHPPQQPPSNAVVVSEDDESSTLVIGEEDSDKALSISLLSTNNNNNHNNNNHDNSASSSPATSPDTNGDDDGVKGKGGNSGSSNGNKSDGGGKGGDKAFMCSICSRCFGYKHVLQNHERTHTGEKPFECVECHKRFKRDHHLKTHMRLHTGEKPYQCSHCDRHFVQVANLRRHLRVHTGERPYACQSCTSRFSDSNQLKAHMLIHRGEKPFQCSECLGRFRRRHHLIHHKCPKDEANLGRPRRGRRPQAFDTLRLVGDDDDPMRHSENDEDEDDEDNIITTPPTRHNHVDNHVDTVVVHNTPTAQVFPVIHQADGRKPANAVRILTPQQRELFLRDKVSMQTQAIDMRVSSEVPVRTVIVPPSTRFVDGVLDLSSSRSDSEIDAIDDVHDVCMRDRPVTKMNGNKEGHDDEYCDTNHRIHNHNHTPLHGTVRSSIAITRRHNETPVIRPRRPSVLVSKVVEPLNGTSSNHAHEIEKLCKHVNGESVHFYGEQDDDQQGNRSHPLHLTKKASIATA